jgi:general L-amino acid transport system permease protein
MATRTADSLAPVVLAPPRVSPAWMWVRENLFAGRLGSLQFYANSLASILLSVAIAWLAYRFISWAFIGAIWAVEGQDTRICRDNRETGACWALITETNRFILFGTYTYEEQWRPALAIVLFCALYGVSALRQFWNAKLAVIWIVGLIAIGILMWGGTIVVPASLIVLVAGLVAAAVVARKSGSSVGLAVAVITLALFVQLVGGWIFSLPAVSIPTGLTFVENEKWGGLPLTLILATFGIALAFPLAIFVALGRRSNMPAIRMICVTYVELVRGVPLISVLFMASVMFPLFLPEGITIDKLLRAQVAVILFSAAYLAEVVRGGLQAIPKGQYEAADAMGLSYWKKTGFIILPQALRICIPPLVNTFIGLFKDTSLVSIIGLYDLLQAAKTVTVEPRWQGFGVEAYLFISVIYWVFCYSMSKYSQNLEAELSQHTKR